MDILEFLSFHRRVDKREKRSTEIEKEEISCPDLLQSDKFKKNLPKHILYQRMLRERYENKYEVDKGEYENAD